MTIMDTAERAEATLPLVEIFVDGELTSGTLGKLHRQLVEASALSPDRVLVDLTSCRFFDVDTIRVLLDAHTRLWRQGGRLALRGAGQPLMRLLATAGLRGVFEFEPAAHAADWGIPTSTTVIA